MILPVDGDKAQNVTAACRAPQIETADAGQTLRVKAEKLGCIAAGQRDKPLTAVQLKAGVTIGIVGFIYMVFLLSERCGGDAGTSPLCGYAINPRN